MREWPERRRGSGQCGGAVAKAKTNSRNSYLFFSQKRDEFCFEARGPTLAGAFWLLFFEFHRGFKRFTKSCFEFMLDFLFGYNMFGMTFGICLGLFAFLLRFFLSCFLNSVWNYL